MRASLIKRLVFGFFAAVAVSPQLPADDHQQRPCKTWRSGKWLVQESQNFRVCSLLSESQTGELAAHCEALRARLTCRWFGAAVSEAWQPRCEIVVWRDVAAYGQALGRPGDRSVGCATCDIDSERVVRRRIDLRADAADWWRSALPHELTHVVFADRFAGHPLAPWADEGIAVLAEPASKRQAREAALARARQMNRTYRVGELLQVNSPPEPRRRDAFYGQSAALADLLVARKTPAAFVNFLEQAQLEGYEAALRRTYGLRGIADLESLLAADLQKRSAAARPADRSSG